MKILFVGGTRFVGLAMAREAISRGHEVEIFHRSEKIPVGTESAKHLLGDRTKDFTSLQTGNWDVVVDVCGYRPHEINALYDVFVGFDSSVPTYRATTGSTNYSFLKTGTTSVRAIVQVSSINPTLNSALTIYDSGTESLV